MLNRAVEILAAAGIASARAEAEILLAHLLGCARIDLYLDETAPGAATAEFAGLVRRRAERVPLQYLTGEADFAGESFRVGPGVFIPRPETEVLLETAGELLAGRLRGRGNGEELLVADVGTGCGNLAVALTKRTASVRIMATEISPAALAAARENIRRHRREARIGLFLGDLLAPLNGKFDLIVANPPYLTRTEMAALEPEVRAEPRQALDGGEEGLDCLIRLIRESPPFLRPEGWLVMEIGDGQFGKLKEIFAETGAFSGAAHRFDLTGRERVIYARRNEK